MFFLSLLLLFVAVNAQMNTTDMPANDSLALCTVETEMVDCSARGYCLEKEEALDENAADTNSDGSYDTTGMSCFCDDGYTTYYSDDYENYPQCNYKQKEQLVAFLLRFLFLFCSVCVLCLSSVFVIVSDLNELFFFLSFV